MSLSVPRNMVGKKAPPATENGIRETGLTGFLPEDRVRIGRVRVLSLESPARIHDPGGEVFVFSGNRSANISPRGERTT